MRSSLIAYTHTSTCPHVDGRTTGHHTCTGLQVLDLGEVLEQKNALALVHGTAAQGDSMEALGLT
jgi:hypothetical protein